MRDKRFRVLGFGAGISALMLIILAIAHSQGATFLALESRWLIVAGIPLLVALFAGGYITRFKGLGIELEGALQETVDKGDLSEAPEVTLQASDVAEEAEVVAKGSLDQLFQLPQENRDHMKRLSFVMGRHYYPEVIGEYFDSLPELQFLEVRDQSGALSCILPEGAIGEANMSAFVDSLAKGTVPQDFRPLIIKSYIRSQDSFLMAIEKLRMSGLDALPVVEGSDIIGVLDRSSAFERLADALVEARLRT